MDIFTRIADKLAERGSCFALLCRTTEIPYETMASWKGDNLPDVCSLSIVASHFGTTVHSLLGEDYEEYLRRTDPYQ